MGVFDISKHRHICEKCGGQFPFDVFEKHKTIHYWTTRHVECGTEYQGALMYVKDLDFDKVLETLKPKQDVPEEKHEAE